MSKYLRVILLAFLAFSSAARASDDDWRVAKSTTQVTYSLDLDVWSDVHVGEVIPNKAWLSTGPRGRLQLTRGVETISLQPNTLASITTSGFFTRKTEILQQAGALDLEIEKRSALIESATELTPDAARQIVENLKRNYGNDVSTQFVTNPELLGGMRIRVGDDVWDSSVRNRLQRLANQL